VFVLAVIYRMDKLMDEGVQDLYRLIKCRGDEDLITLIGRAFLGPALTNMVASSASAGKSTRNLAVMRQLVVFLGEQRADSFDGG
jgi:hypothetical protein